MTRLSGPWPRAGVRSSRRAGLVVVAALLALASSPAQAQQVSPQFTREYQAGIDAYRLGDYARARVHLLKAADLEVKLPGPHRWLAAVDQAEEKWAACVAHARTAIRLNPQSSEIAATRQLHDECRISLGKPAFAAFEGGGALAVTTNATGAVISVNGLRYGVAPLAPRALAAGSIEVTIDKPGWLKKTLDIVILPGVVTDVDVVLDVDPKAQVAAPDDQARPTMPTTGWLVLDIDAAGAEVLLNGMVAVADGRGRFERPPGTFEVTVTAPGRDRWRRRVRIARGQQTRVLVDLPREDARRRSRRIGIGAVLGATALAGAGVTFAVLAGQAREEAGDWWEIERTRPGPEAVPLEESSRVEPVHTRADIEDAVDRGDRWALLSNISYGVAAVGLGVGIYFLVAERPIERDGQPAPFAIAPVVGDGGVGVAVSKEIRW